MKFTLSTFEIFEEPPVDISVDDIEDIQVLPMSGVTNYSVIDFYVAPLSN